MVVAAVIVVAAAEAVAVLHAQIKALMKYSALRMQGRENGSILPYYISPHSCGRKIAIYYIKHCGYKDTPLLTTCFLVVLISGVRCNHTCVRV